MRAVRETDELREAFEVRCRENFGRTEFESCELRCFNEWFSCGGKGDQRFFLFFSQFFFPFFFFFPFHVFLGYNVNGRNATQDNLTSFASGTAKSHCEPSTGDAKASAEYAAVATPAIPEVIVHK